MTALKTIVRIFCLIPFLTGAVDVVNGIGLLSSAGVPLQTLARDPTLNSQVGFWGAIWFGYGVVLWRASSHLQDEPEVFRLLCLTLFLSGLARLGALMVYGRPAPVLLAAMAIELVGGAALPLWHRRARRELLGTTMK